MNAENFEKQMEIDHLKETKILDSYLKRGFLRDESEKSKLHMAFSPFRVPRGLTKLQIRRRLSKTPNTTKYLFPNSLVISINDKVMVRASFTSDIPKSHKKLQNLVKSVLWK